MTTDKYTGPEKAAILLMALGEDSAAKIFSQMEEKEIQTLGNYISALGDIDAAAMDAVTMDFYKAVEDGAEGIGIGGIDFLKATLAKALDPAKASEIVINITTPSEDMTGGLETVRMLEPKVIASFLGGEHPQTAAIVMAHLDPATASATLKELSAETRLDIVYRLSTLDRVSPKILRELDEARGLNSRHPAPPPATNWAASPSLRKLWARWTEKRKRPYLPGWTKLTQASPPIFATCVLPSRTS